MWVGRKLVIKPINGGASIDMIVARADGELDFDLSDELLNKYGELMAEEYIEGQELAVGILGEVVLPIVEIIPPNGKWFDLDSKYDLATQENIPPQHISEELQKRARALALQIHHLMGCKDLSRTDMIIKGDDIYVLETNTMPGMTPMSLYPKEAKAAGYDMPALVKKLVELAK
jgi:D-alanine-D-alanine ligase